MKCRLLYTIVANRSIHVTPDTHMPVIYGTAIKVQHILLTILVILPIYSSTLMPHMSKWTGIQIRISSNESTEAFLWSRLKQTPWNEDVSLLYGQQY